MIHPKTLSNLTIRKQEQVLMSCRFKKPIKIYL